MARALSLMVLALLSGCAASSELALRPDETPTLLTLRVAYEEGDIVRHGGRHDVAAGRAPAWSADAQRYLRASDAAAAALATPAVTFHRLVNDARPYVVVVVTGGIAGAAVGAANAASAPKLGPSAAFGAVVGTSSSLVIAALAGATLPGMFLDVARDDYERAVMLFNRDVAASVREHSAPSPAASVVDLREAVACPHRPRLVGARARAGASG